MDVMNFSNEHGRAMTVEEGKSFHVPVIIARVTGRGMGTTLVKSLEEHARERGFEELTFSIPSSSLIKVLKKRSLAGQLYRYREDWSELLGEHYDVIYTNLKEEKKKKRNRGGKNSGEKQF
jgi:hypothetical protein